MCCTSTNVRKECQTGRIPQGYIFSPRIQWRPMAHQMMETESEPRTRRRGKKKNWTGVVGEESRDAAAGRRGLPSNRVLAASTALNSFPVNRQISPWNLTGSVHFGILSSYSIWLRLLDLSPTDSLQYFIYWFGSALISISHHHHKVVWFYPCKNLQLSFIRRNLLLHRLQRRLRPGGFLFYFI